MSANPNLTASGTIQPYRFVKVSGVMTVAAAGANEDAIGISQASTRNPTDTSPTAHAISGGSVALWSGGGDTALLELGGSVTAGDELIAGSAGVGVTRATTGTTIQNVAAVALESGSSGDVRRVMLRFRAVRPALT